MELDQRRILQGLQPLFESLEMEPTRRKLFQELVEEMATMKTARLAAIHEQVMGKKDQKTQLSNVLVISGGSRYMIDEALDEDSIFDQEAKSIWDNARYLLRPSDVDLGQNVTWSQFWEKVKGFAKVMRKDGIYFFYYAGHGSEIDGSFHFIPKGARDEQDCIPIGIVMAHFDEFAGFGCQVIFCINACRDREHLQSPINKAYDNEYGKANRYYILFSTSSGEDVPLQDHQDVFKKVVEESMHLFKSDNVLSVLEQMFDEIGKLDSQQNPRLLCGGLRDPSSRASSGSNFSFAMPGNWLDRLQGYTLMKANTSSSFRMSPSSQMIQIKDTREDQRRRLNRFTAPTFDPACVIIGHTSGKSAEERIHRFQEQGMGPNYLIAEDGTCYLFVKENHMAWEYNLAYWGGSCGVIEGEGMMASKGRINELKTYAISVALEGNGQRDYTEMQYDALIALLQELKKTWQLEMWNILSAAEVVQPPQKEEEAEPGPKFDWTRLAKVGLSLDVEEGSLQPSSHLDEDELREKMKEWGYAFGLDSDEHFQRRLSAFRQRYLRSTNLGGATFSGYDTPAVESLLRQRRSMQK